MKANEEVTNNDRRAAWARAAVNTFTLETYGNRLLEELHPDDQYTAVQDLLTDLMHLLDRSVVDPGGDGEGWLRTMLESAAQHHDAEVREEEADPAG